MSDRNSLREEDYLGPWSQPIKSGRCGGIHGGWGIGRRLLISWGMRKEEGWPGSSVAQPAKACPYYLCLHQPSINTQSFDEIAPPTGDQVLKRMSLSGYFIHTAFAAADLCLTVFGPMIPGVESIMVGNWWQEQKAERPCFNRTQEAKRQ